ncbi:MAG: PIG-L deacetylase family protein [Candidatus Aminicenantaceae bacterium]
MINFNKILALSPHTDDAELGAGSTMVRLIEEGKEVYYVAFSSCRESLTEELPSTILKEECENSTKIIGISPNNLFLLDYKVRAFPQYRQQILENLVEFNDKIKPDLVLIPSSHDMHQDHQTIYNEALRAFKKNSSIWGYEHPWNNLTFNTDIFVKLTERHVRKKIEALAKYKSQDFREYFDEKNVQGIAYTRGTQVNFEFAEAFELIRFILI